MMTEGANLNILEGVKKFLQQNPSNVLQLDFQAVNVIMWPKL